MLCECWGDLPEHGPALQAAQPRVPPQLRRHRRRQPSPCPPAVGRPAGRIGWAGGGGRRRVVVGGGVRFELQALGLEGLPAGAGGEGLERDGKGGWTRGRGYALRRLEGYALRRLEGYGGGGMLQGAQGDRQRGGRKG